MKKKITIAIDAMGGDNSPSKSVKGVGLFLSKNKFKNDFIINLFGDEKQIRKVLNENKQQLVLFDCPKFKLDKKYHRGIFGMFMRFIPYFSFKQKGKSIISLLNIALFFTTVLGGATLVIDIFFWFVFGLENQKRLNEKTLLKN